MFLFASKTNNSQWATDELTNILKTEPNVSHWTYEQVHVFLCSEPELIPQKVLKRVKQEEWSGSDLLEKGCSWYYLTKFLKLSSSDATSFLLAVDKLKKRTGLPTSFVSPVTFSNGRCSHLLTREMLFLSLTMNDLNLNERFDEEQRRFVRVSQERKTCSLMELSLIFHF